jgi:hypothetical protein
VRRFGRIVLWVVVALVIAALTAVGVALAFTSQSPFFAKYPDLARREVTLEASAHRGIPCVRCHTGARGSVIENAALVGDFYSSLFATSTAPVFFSFTPPSSEACLGCHRDAWSQDSSKTANVPHPAHLRVASETRDCVTCHRWTAHEEPYQAKHTTMPFSAVCASFQCHVGTKTSLDCVNCHHVLQETAGDWVKNHPPVVRAAGPGGCLEFCHKSEQCVECHTTGRTPVLPSSLATASAGPIEQAHVKPDWLSQHGTIALQDPAKCSVCHISNGECVDCHSQRPAFHDPAATWLTRHKDLATDTRRCLTCHQQPWCDACHAQFKETH